MRYYDRAWGNGSGGDGGSVLCLGAEPEVCLHSPAGAYGAEAISIRRVIRVDESFVD